MKASKKTNHTVEAPERTKIVDTYKDLFTFREKPVSEAFLERLMLEAINEAINNETVFKVTYYFRKKGISDTTLRRWRTKYAWFDEAYCELVRHVGDVRELGALHNKLNTQVVLFTGPIYDQDWKDETIRKAQLKDENAQGPGS